MGRNTDASSEVVAVRGASISGVRSTNLVRLIATASGPPSVAVKATDAEGKSRAVTHRTVCSSFYRLPNLKHRESKVRNLVLRETQGANKMR